MSFPCSFETLTPSFQKFLQVPVEAFKIERRSSLIDLLNSGRSQSGIEEQALSCYTDEGDEEEESPSMPWWMAITV